MKSSESTTEIDPHRLPSSVVPSHYNLHLKAELGIRILHRQRRYLDQFE